MTKYSTYIMTVMLSIMGSMPMNAQYFAAPYDKATWDLYTSPLMCRMQQDIPGYGRAILSRQNGAELKFTLRNWLGNMDAVDVALYSKAPAWQTKPHLKRLKVSPLRQSHSVVVYQATIARKIYDALYDGLLLRFKYTKPKYMVVRVDVLPMHFRSIVDRFNRCVVQLLPYQYEDVSKSILQFEPGSNHLTKAARARLKQVIDYAMADEQIVRIRIDGHSDMDGRKGNNIYLSKQRANNVRDFMIQNGVEDFKLDVHWYGGKKPIANNETAAGREMNRRVEVKLIK